MQKKHEIDQKAKRNNRREEELESLENQLEAERNQLENQKESFKEKFKRFEEKIRRKVNPISTQKNPRNILQQTTQTMPLGPAAGVPAQTQPASAVTTGSSIADAATDTATATPGAHRA